MRQQLRGFFDQLDQEYRHCLTEKENGILGQIDKFVTKSKDLFGFDKRNNPDLNHVSYIEGLVKILESLDL